MNSMTMQDLYSAAKTAAAKAYAAGRYNLSMSFTNAQALAEEALEAEKQEYDATLALFSCFPSSEEEEAALEAERVAISAASWARLAAWNAFEAAQEAFQAEEAEEVRAYEARCAAHEATLAEVEEEDENDGWGDIALEAMLRDLSSGDRDFLCGEESPQDIAREWHSQGFTPASMREWAFRARCFRAEAARALTVSGLNPEDCRARGPYGETIGYRVANGDMSLQDALQALVG
jgi:hypothetical protein